MVLISVDFPQPFGPRIATCSPAPIVSEKSRSAMLAPRITVTLRSSIRGGGGSGELDTSPVSFGSLAGFGDELRRPVESRESGQQDVSRPLVLARFKRQDRMAEEF